MNTFPHPKKANEKKLLGIVLILLTLFTFLFLFYGFLSVRYNGDCIFTPFQSLFTS